MMKIYNLYNLEEKRERCRKEINTLMRRRDYYTDSSLYDRVKALTGLEMYLTYSIEKMKDELDSIDDKYIKL